MATQDSLRCTRRNIPYSCSMVSSTANKPFPIKGGSNIPDPIAARLYNFHTGTHRDIPKPDRSIPASRNKDIPILFQKANSRDRVIVSGKSPDIRVVIAWIPEFYQEIV